MQSSANIDQSYSTKKSEANILRQEVCFWKKQDIMDNFNFYQM